jgi:hypothetical protein
MYMPCGFASKSDRLGVFRGKTSHGQGTPTWPGIGQWLILRHARMWGIRSDRMAVLCHDVGPWRVSSMCPVCRATRFRWNAPTVNYGNMRKR